MNLEMFLAAINGPAWWVDQAVTILALPVFFAWWLSQDTVQSRP